MIPTTWAQSSAAPSDPATPASVLSYDAPQTERMALSAGGLDMLRQTRPWVAFISSVMAVMGMLVGILGVGGLFFVAQRNPRALSVRTFGIYLVLALVYFVPAALLRRYSDRLKKLIETQAGEHLDAALEAQKTFWQVMGILTAIVVGLYAIILFFALSRAGLRGLFR